MQDLSEVLMLDELDEIIYISDVDTYEILYMNRAGRRLFQGRDCCGKKCHEVLQNRSMPCEYCNNLKLSIDKFYVWEHGNEISKRHYLLKDKLVKWQGRYARMEIAVDITEKEKDTEMVRERLEFEKTLVSCVQELAQGKNLEEGMLRLLERVVCFYQAQRACIVRYSPQEDVVKLLYDYSVTGLFQMDRQWKAHEEIRAMYEAFVSYKEAGILKEIEQLEADYPTVCGFCREEGITGFTAYPMKGQGKLSGYFIITNPARNLQWIELLDSLSVFIETEIFKNRAVKELEKLNAELEIQNERYITLQNLSRSIIFEYNYERDSMELFAGESAGRSIVNFRETVFSVIHPDDIPVVSKAFRASLSGTVYQVVELRTNLIQDGFQWYRAVITTIYGRDRRALRLIGRLENIGNEKNKRVMNEVTLKRMQLAVNNSYTVVMALDVTQNRYWIIQKAETEMHMETEGHFGDFIKNCMDAMHPEDREEAGRFLDRAYILETFKEPEFQYVFESRLYKSKKQDYFWYENTVMRVEDPVNDGIVLLLLVRDINRYKSIETSLRSTLRSLESASRAKSDFLSRVSHDIRTPINGIIGMTEIAKEVPGTPVRALACLDKVKISSDYLLRLVNNILEMSKIEAGKLELTVEQFGIEDLLEGIRSVFDYQMQEKGLDFQLEIENVTRDALLGDRLKITQILTNLIGNAIKFTEPGGHVQLHVLQNHREDNRVFLQFLVKDDGIGISADFLEKIFDSFTQEQHIVQRMQTGSGLGLSICKSILSIMGGQISVTSRVGMGSIFDVRIPLELAGTGEADSSGIEEAAADGVTAGTVVLLVEDNELNAEISEYFLSGFGMKVEKACNGEEAVRMVADSKEGYYQVILMDIMMPVMGGHEAARRIRRLARQDAGNIPIIAMTANAFKEDVAHCLASGMNDHVAKPVEVETLKKTISQWLAGGRGTVKR